MTRIDWQAVAALLEKSGKVYLLLVSLQSKIEE